MNAPEDETVTYVMVDSQKASQIQSANKSQLAAAAGDLTGGGNLDKVRDILFGNQIRDQEKRFTRLEERFTKECNNLRDESRERLESLEIYIQKEVESLTERLKTEQAERDTAVQELTQEIKDLAKALEKKLALLDEQTTQNQRDLRQQILDQSKSLGDLIRQKHEEATSGLEREAQELRVDKTDRSALASLFTEMAMRLNHDFHASNNG